MENTYWNGKGKHESESKRIAELIPRFGITNNPYLNLFITSSCLYYDIYNNGGCNIKECYQEDIEKYIVPYADEIKSINFKCKLDTIYRNLKNKEKLESFMDSIIEFVSNKDLSYDKYVIYYNLKKELLSYDKKEGFEEVTFGNKEELEKWQSEIIRIYNAKVIKEA